MLCCEAGKLECYVIEGAPPSSKPGASSRHFLFSRHFCNFVLVLRILILQNSVYDGSYIAQLSSVILHLVHMLFHFSLIVREYLLPSIEAFYWRIRACSGNLAGRVGLD